MLLQLNVTFLKNILYKYVYKNTLDFVHII
jgi:hypothetical protein